MNGIDTAGAEAIDSVIRRWKYRRRIRLSERDPRCRCGHVLLDHVHTWERIRDCAGKNRDGSDCECTFWTRRWWWNR